MSITYDSTLKNVKNRRISEFLYRSPESIINTFVSSIIHCVYMDPAFRGIQIELKRR